MSRGGGRGVAAVGQRPLPLLGAVRARLGALLRGRARRWRSRPGRRARASAGGWPAGRCRRPAAGPGWQLACARFEAGEVQRGAGTSCTRSAATTCRTRSPPSAASTGRSWRSSSSRSGVAEAAEGYVRRAEALRRRRSDLQLPTALALRTRAAVLLAARRAARRRRSWRRRRRAAPTPSARGCMAAFARRWPAARSPRRATATAAIAHAARGRVRARRVRLGARARRDAPRAAQARRARGDARPGDGGGVRRRRADQARARDRRARHATGGPTARSPRRCFSATRRSSRTCATSSSSSACRSRVEVARAVERDRSAA